MRKFPKTAGFTLLEIILVMVLLGIMVAATGVMMGRSVDIYALVGDRTEIISEARYAMVRMEKELEGLTDVQSTSATRIGFRDSGGASTDFNLTGTNLFRGSDLLARNISSLNFTCYRDDGAVTSSAQQTRRIQIDMTVTSPGAGGSFPLRTDVFPKNFMYENFR